MKKSYTIDQDGSYRLNSDIDVFLKTGASVLVSEELATKNMTLNTDWQSVTSSVTDAGTLEVIKIIQEIKPLSAGTYTYGAENIQSRSKFVTVTVSNGTGADNLVVGSALVLEAKNSAGTVLQTRNYIFPVLAADATNSVVFKLDGIFSSDDVDIVATITYAQSAAAEIAVPTMLIEISDISKKSRGCTFVEGASVAGGSAITTNLQFVDEDGAAITDREIVEIAVLSTLDAVGGASAISVGTNGVVIGTMSANNTIMALTESDGSLDVLVTKAASGQLRITAKNANADLSFSDYLIWS